MMLPAAYYAQLTAFNEGLKQVALEQPPLWQSIKKQTDQAVHFVHGRKVQAQELHRLLIGSGLLPAGEESIPLQHFLWLYSFIAYNKQPKDAKGCVSLCVNIESDPMIVKHPELEDLFTQIARSCLLWNRWVIWEVLIKGLDNASVQQINEYLHCLPFSHVDLRQVLNWLTKGFKAEDGSGFTRRLGLFAEQWLLLTPSAEIEVAQNLTSLALQVPLNQLFPFWVRGLQQIRPASFETYRQQLESHIQPDNAFPILLALGSVSEGHEGVRTVFWNFLLFKFEADAVLFPDFIKLCTQYGFYRQEVYTKITAAVSTTDDISLLLAIIAYMQQAPVEVDPDWYQITLVYVFCRHQNELTPFLNELLHELAEKDLDLAYTVFEARLMAMAGNQLLEEGFTEMVRRDPIKFQQNFVRWLFFEDHYIHLGLRQIAALPNLSHTLFFISSEVYELYTPDEQLYLAYKMVGYIYSMEELQQLLLSLACVIEFGDEYIMERFRFIFSEYLIYNYRSTLDLLRRQLEEGTLPAFAENLFKTVVQEFETYFAGLRSITVQKELQPYLKWNQLRQFYFSRSFSNLPHKPRKSIIQDFFSEVAINANQWAIRRSTEYRHKPQPLGRISVEAEYPSGEKLNPTYQEYIRRTYQNLTKDEIGIN